MFPQLEDPKIVYCFNCYQDHYDPSIVETDNLRGKYYMVCDTCGMRTFFDLIENLYFPYDSKIQRK